MTYTLQVITRKKSIALALALLLSLVSYSQKRNFSPWIVVKSEQYLMDYVEPIIRSGSGDHISLFVQQEKFDQKNWMAFIKACHEGGITTVYKCIGGSEKDFDSPEARKNTVDKWIELAKKYSFDGIDMDLEHLSPDVREEHIIFVKYAAKRMHEEGLKLAMAVGFYPPMVQKPFVWWYDPATIGKYCDNVRVMLYDEYWAGGKMNPDLADHPDSWGIGPTCSYPFARESVEYWVKFTPVEKLTINVPAYSNVYYVDPQYQAGVNDTYTGDGQCSFPRPQDIDKSKPVHKYWSWVDRIRVYIYTSNIDGRLRIFFASDAGSTRHLLDLFEEKGIESVGMWHYQGKQMDKQWNEVNKLILDWTSAKKH